jgi:formate dehydrogenase subunit delta
MNPERLVAMANDIAAFFDAGNDPAAAAQAVRTHLVKFWDPRMRVAIVAHLDSGGDGLGDTARRAVASLKVAA